MSEPSPLYVVQPDPSSALLHDALQKALAPPALPVGLHERVMGAVLAARMREVDERRLALEIEYAKALQRMQARHALLQKETLAMIAVGAFAAGVAASVAVPWLHSTLGLQSTFTAPAIAVVIGALAGASVWLGGIGKTSFWRVGLD